jgi:hypothetical protein
MGSLEYLVLPLVNGRKKKFLGLAQSEIPRHLLTSLGEKRNTI